jgi:hypothetical protein
MVNRHTLIKIFTTTTLIAALTAVVFAFNVQAQTVTQGYASDQPLKRGMIVGLKADDLKKVEAINSDSFDRLHGAVVGANDSSILVGSEDETVYVASGGRFKVLVNDQNGSLAQGDFVTLSAVSGIGKKAGDRDPVVLGKVLDGFDATNTSQVIGTANIKTSTGEAKALNIGTVTVDIAIGRNPILKTDNSLPAVLQRAGEFIAGKPVSPGRIYMSLAILLICSMISGSLIYGGVRSSLISIGRNPLSKKSIIRGLFQVVFIGLMVFLSGIFGVYLLLKL